MPSELLNLTDAQIIIVASAAVGVLLSAFLGWRIGRRKYRPMLGTLLGAFLAIPGLLVISVMPRKEPAYY